MRLQGQAAQPALTAPPEKLRMMPKKCGCVRPIAVGGTSENSIGPSWMGPRRLLLLVAACSKMPIESQAQGMSHVLTPWESGAGKLKRGCFKDEANRNY